MCSGKAPIVGIDLGTTYSLVAVMRDGVPTPLPNAVGEILTPSAVSVDPRGRCWWARRRAVLSATDGDCRAARAALDDMTAQMKGFSPPDPSKPSAFQIGMRWVLDTGCGADQLPKEGRARP